MCNKFVCHDNYEHYPFSSLGTYLLMFSNSWILQNKHLMISEVKISFIFVLSQHEWQIFNTRRWVWMHLCVFAYNFCGICTLIFSSFEKWLFSIKNVYFILRLILFNHLVVVDLLLSDSQTWMLVVNV